MSKLSKTKPNWRGKEGRQGNQTQSTQRSHLLSNTIRVARLYLRLTVKSPELVYLQGKTSLCFWVNKTHTDTK